MKGGELHRPGKPSATARQCCETWETLIHNSDLYDDSRGQEVKRKILESISGGSWEMGARVFRRDLSCLTASSCWSISASIWENERELWAFAAKKMSERRDRQGNTRTSHVVT